VGRQKRKQKNEKDTKDTALVQKIPTISTFFIVDFMSYNM
jgi:hypothetical protein